ncbi:MULTISPECIES: hypothetical protein [unclassified Nocardia]|uniref:hypothetical protein n=1 Tax=unclassified Nocardia TaxID=2637762 RepID=UPI001CE4B2B4|nr:MULTISPECIES: hypothetical protein [unclassified Nocardia]
MDSDLSFGGLPGMSVPELAWQELVVAVARVLWRNAASGWSWAGHVERVGGWRRRGDLRDQK